MPKMPVVTINPPSWEGQKMQPPPPFFGLPWAFVYLVETCGNNPPPPTSFHPPTLSPLSLPPLSCTLFPAQCLLFRFPFWDRLTNPSPQTPAFAPPLSALLRFRSFADPAVASHCIRGTHVHLCARTSLSPLFFVSFGQCKPKHPLPVNAILRRRAGWTMEESPPRPVRTRCSQPGGSSAQVLVCLWARYSMVQQARLVPFLPFPFPTPLPSFLPPPSSLDEQFPLKNAERFPLCTCTKSVRK